jgi:hypothetical protein
LKTLSVLSAALLFTGCSLFEAEGLDRTFQLPVVDLDVPETTAVGQSFTVIITAQITNTCIEFERSEVGLEGDQLSVGAIGRERARPGQNCPVVIEDVETSVRHTPTRAGELLVVAQGYDGPIQATVIVE